MTVEEKHKNDVQFLIECLSQDLVVMIMEDLGVELRQAFDILYNSHTYRKLENESTGLCYQSSVYVFDYLMNELKSQQRGIM